MTEYFGYNEHQLKTGFYHTNTRIIEGKTNADYPPLEHQLIFNSSYMEYNRTGDWLFALKVKEAKVLVEYIQGWIKRKEAGEDIPSLGLFYVSKDGKLAKKEFKS